MFISRVYSFPMAEVSFRAASLLREDHEQYSRAESKRRAEGARARGGDSSHEQVQARESRVQWIPWGTTAEIVGVFDAFETEYAAIRGGAALLDLPQRGVLEVTGSARGAFLQRMLTQDMRQITRGAIAHAFWLNRKGRIDADLMMCEFGERMLIECARSVAAETAASLTKFIIDEDVQVTDSSAAFACLSIEGPKSLDLLARAGLDPSALEALARPSRCAEGTIGSHRCAFARRDLTGEVGIAIFVATDGARDVWRVLLSLIGVDDGAPGGRRRAKPCGWFAFNTARIEAGTPLFEIDFGASALPHETSLLDSRVSFTKGCYLGHEVVARMQSLGKPKQVIRAFRMEGEALPTEGAQVFAAGAVGEPIGQVTSSTVSPMLGGASIGFATIKTAHAAHGTLLEIAAEGGLAKATVLPALAAIAPRSAAPSNSAVGGAGQ